MKKLVLIFGIVFLLISCEKNELTNPENRYDQDLMLKSGKPAQPGDNLKVFRYETSGYYYLLYDEVSNLTAVVGVDIRQLYLDGGQASFDVLYVQEIVKEGDEGESPRVHLKVNQDDITVEVWEGQIIYVSQLFSAEPVYSGTGHLVYTDNDAISPLNDNKNLNVWGLRLNGKGINTKYHAMWHNDDPSTIEETIDIMLK